MNIDLIIDYLPRFTDGLYITLWIVMLSLLFGSALSLPLALVRVYDVPVLSPLSRWYSYVLRGTPLLIQLYLLYYGLSQFPAVRDSWVWPLLRNAQVCLLVGFSLNLAAYLSEIVRGAFQSVPKGEIEAARAFGMSELQAIWHITLPAALRRVIPPLSNQVIMLVHSSSIASMLTVVDILGVGRNLNASYYVVLEGFLTAAAYYAVLIVGITFIFRFMEKKYAAFLH